MPGSTKKVLRIFSNDDGWFIGTPYNGWHKAFTPDHEITDNKLGTTGFPYEVWTSVLNFSQAMRKGEKEVLAIVTDAEVFQAAAAVDEAVALVDAMFVQNQIMQVEEEVVASCAGSIMTSLREVGGAVAEFLAGLVGAAEAKAQDHEGPAEVSDEPIHVEGNNRAFIITTTNDTAGIPLHLAELHLENHVLIQTSQLPGESLPAGGNSQALAYGYSSWTKLFHAESSCWVKWELLDHSWWFGIQIHVPSKGAGMGTWPYYLVSSSNDDGHKGDWWKPVEHASDPFIITPAYGMGKETFKVKITPTSTGSTLNLDVYVEDG